MSILLPLNQAAFAIGMQPFLINLLISEAEVLIESLSNLVQLQRRLQFLVDLYQEVGRF